MVMARVLEIEEALGLLVFVIVLSASVSRATEKALRRPTYGNMDLNGEFVFRPHFYWVLELCGDYNLLSKLYRLSCFNRDLLLLSKLVIYSVLEADSEIVPLHRSKGHKTQNLDRLADFEIDGIPALVIYIPTARVVSFKPVPDLLFPLPLDHKEEVSMGDT
jgi:hypothetical protein